MIIYDGQVYYRVVFNWMSKFRQSLCGYCLVLLQFDICLVVESVSNWVWICMYSVTLLCKINLICLPTEYQGVHKNSCRNVRAFQDRIGMRRGENWSPQRKTSRSRVENQQQTQPTYDAGSRNQTRATLVGGERSHHCTNPDPIHSVTFQVFRIIDQ